MSKRILIVDDEQDIASVLIEKLAAYGYEAVSAVDGNEALKIIKTERFDLFILDLLMPVMDGMELGRVLKEDPKTRGIPRIFLTSLQAKRGPEGYSFTGGDMMFAKPFEFRELAGKIDELLKGNHRHDAQ